MGMLQGPAHVKNVYKEHTVRQPNQTAARRVNYAHQVHTDQEMD